MGIPIEWPSVRVMGYRLGVFAVMGIPTGRCGSLSGGCRKEGPRGNFDRNDLATFCF
jgi:hypothetical protein